jgi:hypothetical protein
MRGPAGTGEDGPSASRWWRYGTVREPPPEWQTEQGFEPGHEIPVEANAMRETPVARMASSTLDVAIVFLFGVVVVVSNLVTDLAYAYIDPRIRYN